MIKGERETLYLIWFYLRQDRQIHVGKLGRKCFPAGDYIYIGSAKRAIGKRLSRHRRLEKPMRWHIDYFRPHASWKKGWRFTEQGGECALRLFVEEKLTGRPLVPSFGSSDCRCAAHLLYVPEMTIEDGRWIKQEWNHPYSRTTHE